MYPIDMNIVGNNENYDDLWRKPPFLLYGNEFIGLNSFHVLYFLCCKYEDNFKVSVYSWQQYSELLPRFWPAVYREI